MLRSQRKNDELNFDEIDLDEQSGPQSKSKSEDKNMQRKENGKQNKKDVKMATNQCRLQAEEEEEVGENFQDTELELLDGDREGTKWLVINGVHIC